VLGLQFEETRRAFLSHSEDLEAVAHDCRVLHELLELRVGHGRDALGIEPMERAR